MEASVPVPAIALRSSNGVEVWTQSRGKKTYEYQEGLPREETKHSKAMCFSGDGRYLAYSNGIEVKVFRTNDWEIQCILPRPRVYEGYMKFSPLGTYLCIWELYIVTKDIPEKTPNLYLYEIEKGNQVLGIVQKNQTLWEPSWSSDESIVAIMVGGEIFFYSTTEKEGFKSPVKRIGGRYGLVSLSPSNGQPFVALYLAGTKGAPSMCKVYKYPYLGLEQPIACKSFYNADHVEILWNNRGNGLLVLASTDVDKSGASYYGNQSLHFLATKGDSCSVVLAKTGPVHCVKWSPKSTQFIVVYGYVPMKATLFNIKCDPIFDFGEGPRNAIYFNPFGNVVVLAGFGNLPGHVEVWDVEKHEKLADMKCPDTTYFDWHPNGEFFLTATTAPRLRIGNGFKMYHYSGALLHETIWPAGQELYGVLWKQFPKNTFTAPIITKVKQIGIKSSQPEASKKVYTPPHLRLLKEGKDPQKFVPQLPSSTAQSAAKKEDTDGNTHTSNNDAKRQGKGNNRNKKGKITAAKSCTKLQDKDSANENMNMNTKDNSNDAGSNQKQPQQQNQQQPQQQSRKKQSMTTIKKDTAHVERNDNDTTSINIPKEEEGSQILSTENVQESCEDENIHDKGAKNRTRKVMKKLQGIQSLKLRQEQGEVLSLYQLQKIATERKLIEELKAIEKST